MENYSRVYIQQLSPLIHFNGSNLAKDDLEIIKNELEKFDVDGKVWDDSIIVNRLSSTKYIIRTIDDPSESALTYKRSQTDKSNHSSLSPFNIESKLFPNGILGEDWFNKYTKHVPFVYIKALSLSNDEGNDDMLIEEINTSKNSYQELRIKFIPLFISDCHDSSQVQRRMNEICKSTELMNTTSYVFLSRGSETYKSDIEVSIYNLLTNLRTYAHTFYSDIMSRIRLRSKKYYSFPPNDDVKTNIEMSPKFLEARNLLKQGIIDQFANSHSFDQGLKALENCHTLMVEIIHEIFVNINEDAYDNDLKLYSQFRTLTDIIALHIVRGYFSLEEPVSALKKHKMHIENHLDFLPISNDTTIWLSVQYEWLGDLMKEMPQTILSLEENLKSNNKNSKIERYLGGIKFLGDYEYNITTKPGLVYLEAFNQLIKLKKLELSKANHLRVISSSKELVDHKIHLLSSSASLISKYIELDDPDSKFYKALEMYILWEMSTIASEEKELLADSISRLEKLSHNEMVSRWTPISKGIKLKLLELYKENGLPDSYLQTLIELALIKDLNFTSLNSISPEKLGVRSVACQESHKWYSIKSLIYSEDDNKTMSAGEACHTQLEVSSLISLEALKNIFPSSVSTSITINEVIVDYECVSRKSEQKVNGFKNIRIENDSSLKDSFIVEVEHMKDTESYHDISANLSFENRKSKIIRCSQQISKPGLYRVKSVTLKSVIVVQFDKNEVSFTKDEEHIFEAKKRKRNTASIYKLSAGNNFITTSVRCEDILDTHFKVVPLKPNISLKLANNVNNIFLGEKISIPIDITGAANNNSEVKYKSISISPTLKIVDASEDVNPLFTLQVSWDDLKDDEALIATSLCDDKLRTETHNLNLKAMIPPMYFDQIKDKILYIIADMKLIVNEDEASSDPGFQTSIYNIANFQMRMLCTPFDCSFDVIPEYDRKNKVGMPCPFVIKSVELNQTDQHPRVTMPISERLWGIYLNIKDIWELIESKEVEITDCEITVKSNNPDLDVKQHSEIYRCEDNVFHRSFITENTTGFSHRSVGLVISGLIKWVRSGGKESTFKTKDWEIALPVVEPRLLLIPHRISETVYVLHYIIENPTPRLLNFTTQMKQETPDEPSWNFVDSDNIVPIKQAPFPVMPYNRHTMKFKCEYIGSDFVRKVPDFKVFDIQYKVMLPVVPASKELVSKEHGLYLK